MSHSQVRVRRLTSRSAVGWMVATLLVSMAVIGYLAVTQPENRWACVVIAALILLAAVAVLGSRQWVDPEQRTLTWQRAWVVRSTVPAGDVDDVRLEANRAGGVVLRVRAGRRRRYLLVLQLSQYVRASQPPDVCLALAEVVAAMTRAGGEAASVADQLRAQARSLEGGEAPERSALAGRASDRFTKIVGGGGALGGGTSQLP